MSRLKKLSLAILSVLILSTSSHAVSMKCLIDYWYNSANQGDEELTPCTDYGVTWAKDTWIADEPKLLDLFATGTHEATEAQYLDIDTPYTITFAGMGAGVTLSSHGGTATVDLTNGTLTCSVAGTLFDMVLSDGSTYSCGQGTGLSIISDQVGGIEGVLVGFTLDDDWGSGVDGHTWNGDPGYSKDVTDGVELVDDFSISQWVLVGTTIGEDIDASSIKLSYGDNEDLGRIFINASGTGNDLVIGRIYKVIWQAKVGAGDSVDIQIQNGGASYRVAETEIEYTPREYVFTATSTNSAYYRARAAEVGESIWIKDLSIQELHNGYIPADPLDNGLDVFGNTLTNPGSAQQNISVFGYGMTLAGTETFSMARLTGSETVVDSTGTSTVAVVAGGLTFTAGTLNYVELSDGTELVFQCRNDVGDTQIEFWNAAVTTDDSGTIVGGTTPLCDTGFSDSWFTRNGSTISGINLVPGVVGSSLDASGASKGTPEVWGQPVDASYINTSLSKEMYDADLTHIFITAGGVLNDVDPAVIEPIPDYQFINNTDFILYSQDLTGSCLDQTEDYIDTIFLVDDSGEYLIDDSGFFLTAE